MTETAIDRSKLLNTAWALSLFTIIYNVVEGLVSVFFGYQDDTLALFGFGLDSFAEVISGIGIAYMVRRMQKQQQAADTKSSFEKQALRITGFAFYLLTTGITIGAVINIIQKAKPDTTLAGIIISLISILIMYWLYSQKLKVGRELDSAPIVADANCTKACFYLSFILLASSLIYEFTGLPYIDAIGSLGIAWYSFKEGREAFEKAKSDKPGCGDCC